MALEAIFIKATFDKMVRGDLCVYADAGCKIYTPGKPKLLELVERLSRHPSGVVSFVMPHVEENYTNAMTAEYFCAAPEDPRLSSGQIIGGILFLMKTPYSEELVNKFYDIAITRPDLFSDEHNDYKRSPTFIDHRHDQSILSLLRKTLGSSLEIADPTWHDHTYPIQARRIKG